jgi:hypothetical protein
VILATTAAPSNTNTMVKAMATLAPAIRRGNRMNETARATGFKAAN